MQLAERQTVMPYWINAGALQHVKNIVPKDHSAGRQRISPR